MIGIARPPRACAHALIGAVVVIGLAACSGSSTVVNTPTRSVATQSTTPAHTRTPSSTPSRRHTSSTTSAHGPAATVTPSRGLHSGQVVTVRGTGFSPDEQLTVIECASKGSATGPGDCNLAAMMGVSSTSTGTVEVGFTVVRGPFGANRVVCNAKTTCLISVTQASLHPTEEADVPIRFAS